MRQQLLGQVSPRLTHRLRRLGCMLAVGLLVPMALVSAQAAPLSPPVPGSMDVRWNDGLPDCKASSQPLLQVHRYNARTFILRENLCATFEAPFMYLLLGSSRALLIDSGDVAEPGRMPLANTVLGLLPAQGSGRLPLLVVHTHRHLDHRRGDAQFANLPGVQVVGFDLDSVRRFYHFTDWPNGMAQIDLGDRVIDVIPTPGHNQTEVSFYDRDTGLFFSGDFLLPGRLLIDDSEASLASANRVAAFIQDRPISFVLGGHIEMDSQGKLFPWESQYHPNEHVLQLTKGDLLALPAAIRGFNGIYTESGPFVMENSVRILLLLGAAIAAALAAVVVTLIFLIRRRRARLLNGVRS